jgi:hypothetical protein
VQLTTRPCPDCHRPILWCRLTNGRFRTMEPDTVAPGEHDPRDCFVFSKRAGAWVDLGTTTYRPAQVLIAHFCTAYADRKLMRGMTTLADAMTDMPTPKGN